MPGGLGDRMGCKQEPITEDEYAGCVMLKKDNKPICQTFCPNPRLPFEAPSPWTLGILHREKCCLMDLPRCSLRPKPENHQQEREWGIFTKFLRKHDMVGVVKFESGDVFILPPLDELELNCAVVLYHVRTMQHKTSDQYVGTSGRAVNKSDNQECSDNFMITIHGSGNLRGNMPASSTCLNSGLLPSSGGVVVSTHCIPPTHHEESTHHVGKGTQETSNRGDNTLLTESILPHTDARSHDCKPAQSAADFCDRKLVEEATCRWQPTAANKDDSVQRNFVRTDPSYLLTLGQTHSGWIFGAIAELVDNSRDAKATRLDISVECLYSKKDAKKIPVLAVVDDGCGMSHPDILRMLSFGHKQPDTEDPDHIGRFGIGFKTGAMKLGKDAIVLTQTSNSRSVAFLSQSYNANRENLEIPIVTYSKQGHYMEVDLSIQSEASADFYLKAIKNFSPFNEYFLGEKLGLFGENRTGTQIYLWNLDEWGSNYCLDWQNAMATSSKQESRGDILIHSRRIRSRPGQISKEVPLDYSLQTYLEVIFLEPRMKIYVQGSLVKSRPLAKSLNKTAVVEGTIAGKPIQLTLGRSQTEWENMNCGMFIYWHGRLIEAYKRVGGMIHNADMGRGVVGVVDVTHIMNDGNGRVWVLNNKQGFQDCEAYARLEDWLGDRADEYWDANFDPLELKKGNARYKPDHCWVQCNKCRKWRKLSCGFTPESLPHEWFCYLPPFDGKCEVPEDQVERGVITVAAERSGLDTQHKVAGRSKEDKCIPNDKRQLAKQYDSQCQQMLVQPKKSENNGRSTSACNNQSNKSSRCDTMLKLRHEETSLLITDTFEDDSGEGSTQTEEEASPRPILKRLRRGPSRGCKRTSKRAR